MKEKIIKILLIMITFASTIWGTIGDTSYLLGFSGVLGILSLIYLVCSFFFKIKYERKILVTFSFINVFLVVFSILISILTSGISISNYVEFQQAYLLSHLIIPILWVILLFINVKEVILFKDILYPLIVMASYGIILLFLNLLHLVVGPYGFMLLDEVPFEISLITCLLILGLLFIVSLLMRLITIKIKGKSRQ